MVRFLSMPPGLQAPVYEDAQTLKPTSDEAADSLDPAAPSTVQPQVGLPNAGMAIVAILDVTQAVGLVGDTLDVYIQTRVSAGLATPVWVDVMHFTQVLGNGGVKRFYGKLNLATAETMFENASALAASAVRHFTGDLWRCRWKITNAGAASFTFTVGIQPMG